MIKLEIIGNLGADAEIKQYNGNKFVSFHVAHTDKWVDQQTGVISTQTTWVSCSLNGNGGGLTPFLKKGTKVFVRGTPAFVVYSSPKTHKMEAGINLFVREVELCGGNQEQGKNKANTTQTPANATSSPAENAVEPPVEPPF